MIVIVANLVAYAASASAGNGRAPVGALLIASQKQRAGWRRDLLHTSTDITPAGREGRLTETAKASPSAFATCRA